MAAKHKNPHNTDPSVKGSHKEEKDKLFDFDDAFPESPEPDTNPTSAPGKLQELESSLSELKDKNLRLLAEFDNYKKRTSRERIELLGSASRDVILALLPVIDDFERALKSMEGAPDESFTEGVRMIYSRLLNVLQSQGLQAMESTGDAFDPDLHEAITEVPVNDPGMKGMVIDTIEKGYKLNDKIIRHAKVIVGKAD